MLDADAKARTIARLNEKIETESKQRRYRWGYFQGAALIPWSLFLIFATLADLHRPKHDPLVIECLVLLIGSAGLPLSGGLLLKKRWALPLVYAMVGLTLAITAIKVPVATLHYKDPGGLGSALPEAELLLIWLLSMVYYRKRKAQFR